MAARTGIGVRELMTPSYSVTLSGSFQNYFSHQLSVKARKNYNRLKNRLARAGACRLLVHRDKDAIAQWPEFVRIEDIGWKGEGGSSIRRLSDAYQRYYSGLIQLLAERRQLSVYFLELNDTPIAGVMGYVEGDVFHWFKTGYDEQYEEFSPSNLLLVDIIDDLMRNRPEIRRFHMFPTDYGYKHRYANENPLSIETAMYNVTFRGKLVEAYTRTRGSARRIVDLVAPKTRRKGTADRAG